MVALSLPTLACAGDLVVIVSADSGVEKLSREEVVNIFMGRYRKLPNGAVAIPLDVEGESAERADFYQKLLGKSLAEVNAYWARLVFSGRTTAPVAVATQREVLDRVVRDPNAIGYVERRNLNKNVKVVYELKD
jgi:ABC-type phosphate transport system substrate-binding protein